MGGPGTSLGPGSVGTAAEERATASAIYPKAGGQPDGKERNAVPSTRRRRRPGQRHSLLFASQGLSQLVLRGFWGALHFAETFPELERLGNIPEEFAPTTNSANNMQNHRLRPGVTNPSNRSPRSKTSGRAPDRRGHNAALPYCDNRTESHPKRSRSTRCPKSLTPDGFSRSTGAAHLQGRLRPLVRPGP